MSKNQTITVSETRSNEGAVWWRCGWVGAGILQVLLLLLYYVPTPKRMIGDEGYYFHLARGIAAGEADGHHPFWPPLYGEAAGLVFKFLGEHVWMVQGLQILLLSLSAWLLRDVILRHWRHPLLANGTACLLLLSPEWVAFSHYFWPEVAHFFFAMSTLWLWCRWPNQLGSAAVAGLCLAFALLSKLLLLPFVPLCFGVLLVLAGKSWRRQAKRIAVMTGVMFLTLLPTLWKNHQRFGDFMVADSSLFNAWVGLNDTSAADYRNDIAGIYFNEWEAQAGTWQEKKAVFQEKLHQQLDQNGWLQEGLDQFPRQYRRLLDPQTFLVSQLPNGPREAYTSAPSWWTATLRYYAISWHILILSLAAFGFWLVRWRQPSLWWFLAGFLGYNAGLLWLVHVKTRFLLQMWPALLPFTFAACLVGYSFLRRQALPSPALLAYSRTRLYGGLATVVALLLLMLWPR